MFRLVADARLSAEILLALRRVNRSARSASRIRGCFGCGGGGRLGDFDLIIQTISVFAKKKFHNSMFFLQNREKNKKADISLALPE
jgi:hypothetical protein